MRIKNILGKNRNSKKIAVVYKDNEYSYNDIYSQVIFHAKRLMDVKKQNVGIFIHNSVNYVIAYFTIASIDSVIVPFDVNSKRDQIMSTINYCELNLIITDNHYYEYLSKITAEERQKIVLYNLDSSKRSSIFNYSQWERNWQETSVDDDVAIMLHTSGTTSNPKKVMLTHENLISNIESNIASLSLGKDDRSLIVLPMCFGYCNTSQFLTHFYLGASIVIYEGIFVPSRFFHYIEKYQCTNTTCIPSMLYLLVESTMKGYHLSTLRYLCFGGGSISKGILRKVIKMLSNTGVVQTYGQTEAGPRVTCLLPDDSLRKLGSVGKAIPGVSVKIYNGCDEEVENGIEGEIVVQGKNVMRGYFKHQNETNRVIVNGWLHTGDIGKFDNEGYLYIVGRKKNVIISGGLNIYPEEIEEVLRSHPDISEAYVFPRTHELLGEIPVAHVVAKKNVSPNIRKLQEYCKDKLEIQKVPGIIEIVEHIEKTYNGKIRRSGNG